MLNRLFKPTLLMFILPVLIFGQSKQVLTLDACIEQGLKHNQSLLINRFETDRSVSQAKSNIGLVLAILISHRLALDLQSFQY